MVVKIEAAAGLIGLMAVRLDAIFENPFLGCCEIVHKDSEMIDRTSQAIVFVLPQSARRANAVEGDIVIIIANMDGSTIMDGIPTPTDFPAE